MVIDRFAEKYFDNSPYHYALNDPINKIDINGDSTVLIGWNKTVGEYNTNFFNGLNARIDDPSLLLNDVLNASQGIMQLLSDITGISNLVGAENKTANDISDGVNSLMDLPNMSAEEQGIMLAGVGIFLFEAAATKKFPKATFGSKKAALTSLKKDARIPKSQAPISINRVELKNGKKTVLDATGKPIMTREYLHKTIDGNKVIIQDHSAGHTKGNVGSHYNVRPASQPKNGKIKGTLKHYDW
jgi:hypothetical protein